MDNEESVPDGGGMFNVGDDIMIRHDEKAMKDTEQIADNVMNYQNVMDIMETKKAGHHYKNALRTLCFRSGQELYLQVIVKDSLQSSLLHDWLNGKSKLDNGRMHIFGCELNEIGLGEKEIFGEVEKEAVKILYEKAFPNNCVEIATQEITPPFNVYAQDVKCFKLVKTYPGMSTIGLHSDGDWSYIDDKNERIYPGFDWFLEYSEFWQPVYKK